MRDVAGLIRSELEELPGCHVVCELRVMAPVMRCIDRHARCSGGGQLNTLPGCLGLLAFWVFRATLLSRPFCRRCLADRSCAGSRLSSMQNGEPLAVSYGSCRCRAVRSPGTPRECRRNIEGVRSVTTMRSPMPGSSSEGRRSTCRNAVTGDGRSGTCRVFLGGFRAFERFVDLRI